MEFYYFCLMLAAASAVLSDKDKAMFEEGVDAAMRSKPIKSMRIAWWGLPGGTGHFLLKLFMDETAKPVTVYTEWLDKGTDDNGVRIQDMLFRMEKGLNLNKNLGDNDKVAVKGTKTINDIVNCVSVKGTGTHPSRELIHDCNDCRDYVDKVYRYLIEDCACGGCHTQPKKVDSTGRKLYSGKLDHSGKSCDTCKNNGFREETLETEVANQVSAVRKLLGLPGIKSVPYGKLCTNAVDATYKVAIDGRFSQNPPPDVSKNCILLALSKAVSGTIIVNNVFKQEGLIDAWALMLHPDVTASCPRYYCDQVDNGIKAPFAICFGGKDNAATKKLRELDSRVLADIAEKSKAKRSEALSKL